MDIVAALAIASLIASLAALIVQTVMLWQHRRESHHYGRLHVFAMLACWLITACFVGGYIAIVSGAVRQDIVAVRFFRPLIPFLFGFLTWLIWLSHQAVRRQGEFVANVSHELRTPLNIIIGYAEILMRNDAPDRVYHEMILAAADRMRFLINNILSVAKLEHKAALDHTAVRLDLAVMESVRGNEVLARRDNVQVVYTPSPITVRGNEAYLVLMINNVIRNAVKFSVRKEGGGVVNIAVFESDGGGVVKVVDNGVGMTHDVMDNLFKRFYQGDGSDTRRFSGVGLGLYLVKKIVDAHSGRIFINSHEGEGTAVIIWIPSAKSENS